jgi:predicted Ser/Thr protein kinase
MIAKDAILGHVCVERGWMSELDLEECLKECDELSRAKPAAAAEPQMPRVLLRRHLIPEMELEALRVEIEKVLKSDTGAGADGKEELRLLKLLLNSGRLSKANLDDALAHHRQLAAMGSETRVVEVLMEKGYLTLTALEDAHRDLRVGATAVRCGTCKKAYSILHYDAGRIYLCKSCTGELAPEGATPRPAARAPAAVAAKAAAEPARDRSAESSGILQSVEVATDRIGRFGSLREIGRGGMGVVYKAWDEANQRWVALKVITDKHTLEGITRFRREVELSKALHHPNIVALHEFANVDGKHLISMQYIDGTTLSGLRFSPRRAAGMISIVGHALQYAHSRGIIHRDLKPQNIMVDRAGKPYLMDFGLARSTDNPSHVTSVGTAMGTPAYMSPEQALGRSSRVDRRSDLYSLGAVLYSLVTGQPPFHGISPMETLQFVVHDLPVPPSQKAPSVRGPLEDLILKCMQKERNDRYQTAKLIADELERILPQLPA